LATGEKKRYFFLDRTLDNFKIFAIMRAKIKKEEVKNERN